MAFSRLVSSSLDGSPFLLYGNGEQSRDFTYVADVVAAMRQAALSPWTGVANIGGGARTTLNSVIDTIGELLRPIELVRLPVQRGDVRHTAADTSVAESGFGYHPQVSLRDGLALMVEAALKVLPTERSASASRP
jgi:nucleoside-diphosphate-sugar epimerase